VRVPLFKERPSLRPPRRAAGRRVLVIVPPTGAELRSVRALSRRLRRGGVEVDVASECHGEIQGERGRPLNPTLLLIDAAAREWDAVVIGGGSGARDVAEDELARQIVARAAARGKPVAGIGAGRSVLERARVAGFSSPDGDAVTRWLGDALAAAPPAST
jgi:putative intracellular protease/amidase